MHLLRWIRLRSTHPASQNGGRAPGQCGSALIELLVLTAPLCVLAMILTCKLAATGLARISAMEQAAVMTQRRATHPCPGSMHERMLQNAFLGPLTPSQLRPTEILVTGRATETATADAQPEYFGRSAARILPDAPPCVSSSATFLCNEPDGGGGLRRGNYEAALKDLATGTAVGLY